MDKILSFFDYGFTVLPVQNPAQDINITITFTISKRKSFNINIFETKSVTNIKRDKRFLFIINYPEDDFIKYFPKFMTHGGNENHASDMDLVLHFDTKDELIDILSTIVNMSKNITVKLSYKIGEESITIKDVPGSSFGQKRKAKSPKFRLIDAEIKYLNSI